MISRLPHWIWVGAAILAFVAGQCNAVGLLGFEHQALSHVTGIASQLGASMIEDGSRAVRLAAVLASFFAGAVLSGIVVQDSTLRLGRRYGMALLIESALLFVAVALLASERSLGDCCVSCACGLQNAMVSTFSGAVVRTTHLTGTVTDLGVLAGHALRRLPVDRRRLLLGLTLFGGFLLGAATGAVSFRTFGVAALLGPAVLTGITGAAYSAYQTFARRSTTPSE